jgi:GTP-sensing pleiotropic transcriptional regulator CodY
MKTLTTKKRQVKASKVQQQDIVNYHYSVEQVKAQKKANDLIKPTHVETFKTLKSNLIMIDKLENVEGFAQLIKRTMKRFDVSKFKEKFPKLYEEFLVDMDTTEIKIKVQSTTQAFCNILDEEYAKHFGKDK